MDDSHKPKTVTSADGLPIVYEVRGTGNPTLIFVHGWSCDRRYWQEQLEALSQVFQVVAIDLAGHGDSGLGRGYWTMASFGADVAAVVNELSLDQVVLIGHSMGGDVILEAARRLPARVAGLVWLDAYKRLSTPRTPEQIQQILAPFRADFENAVRAFVGGTFPSDANPALVEWVTADMAAAPVAVALAALEASITYDREVPLALQELQLPLVAINSAVPPTDTESLARYGVRAVCLTGVGHFLMLEDPGRVNQQLLTVVKEFAC
jgi:pimeloyl-ACP methyl ester carboxylesterase